MQSPTPAPRMLAQPRGPVVFLTNMPMQYDKAHAQYHQKINVAPAKRYGQIFFIMPQSNLPPDPDDAMELLAKHLQHFTVADYLLLAGPPWLMCWAAIIAAKQTKGRLKLLLWNNAANPGAGTYRVIEADLWATPPEIMSGAPTER